jgi:hypothetical protein
MNGKAALMLIMLMSSKSAEAQKAQNAKQSEPVATTICEVLADPSAFNNKLVQVRGYVTISFEYSLLHSEECSGEIWFALGDGSGPPGLAVTVNGRGTPGETSTHGVHSPPIPIRLIRDANFEKFENYLTESAKVQPGKPCGPDCHLYQVTATFTGRIDGVSKDVHAAHLKRLPSQSSDSKGFGQMGLFDAQLVVQAVKDVEAVDLTHIDKNQPKSH